MTGPSGPRGHPVPFSLGVLVSRTLRAVLGAGLLALALPLLSAAPASAAGNDATVTVVHGVRGLIADVRLDGNLVLSGFAPERVTDPLTIPAGKHRVQVSASGSAPDATPLIDTEVTFTAGQQVTAGVGLGPDGKPVITLFDDAALLASGGSATALAVRGLAAADPVRVVAGDRQVAGELTSTQQQVQQLQPGTYPVSVVPADGSDPVVPAQDIPLVAGRAVALYLIGSQTDGTLGWVAQTILPAAGGAPNRVDTGVGPVPVAGDPGTTALVLGLPIALLGAVAVRRRLRTA